MEKEIFCQSGRIMEINNPNHVLWIDYAKTFGIFFVILGHAILKFNLLHECFFEYLYNFIYMFHMPLFFIISGILYSQKSQSDNFKKILYGLIIPYFIYQIIFFPFKFGQYMTEEHGTIISECIKCFLGILMGDCQNSDFSKLVCGPCWFIVCMVHLRFLYNYISNSKIKIFLTMFVSIILLKLLIINNIDLYFCLDCTLMAIPYFSIGYLLSNYFKKNHIYTKNFKLNFLVTTIIMVILSAIILYISKINGLIELNLKITNETSNQSLFLSYIAGFLGFLLVLNASLLFKSINNFILKISQNTLFIMFFHMLVLFILACFKYFNIISISDNIFIKLLILLLTCLLVLIFNYYVIIILEKYSPIVLGKYDYRKK